MPEVIFGPWKVGMKKISFRRLLQDRAGLTLKEAKSFVDKLLDGDETVKLFIEDENAAIYIVEKAKEYNVVARINDA